MLIRLLFLIAASLALVVPASVQAADRLSFMPLDPDSFADSRNGVVRLFCEDPTNGHAYVSRAVLLDVSGARGDHDVLLAARHGVTGQGGERQCRVYGEDEETGRIIEMVLAPQDPREDNEFGEDWAILRTAGRLPAGITRLQAAGAGPGITGGLTMVNRVMDNRACRVERIEHWADERLIVHTCPSRPGLSGSPMVTMIKGVPHVVGLHVGQYVMLQEDSRRYGVARRLSDHFLETLISFIEADTAR
ncbi:hypothetical protein [uncultured Maricaulis sp.]|uniref:hypothetical protein n=1 Tax=uncultured Maricaulis sp. TaxID=174710 RepID=UPI00262420E2|nr:hypothetical protein [uncultured Maricaulis sp.]